MLPDRAIEGKVKVIRCANSKFGDIEVYNIAASLIEINEKDLALIVELSRAVRLSPL